MEETKQMITRPLETIEGEILFYKQQTAIGIMEIGKRLIEAKAQLPHGTWGAWLKEKVDFTDRTARRFMKCASEFSNRTTLSDLGQSKLFALLDLPIEDREEFIDTPHEVNGELKTVEEMSARELQKAIKEKKEAEKKAQEAENKAKQLEKQLEEEKTKPKEKEIVTKTVEVDKTDYALKDEVERLKQIQKELLDENSSVKKRYELEQKKVEAVEKRNKFLEDTQQKYDELQTGIKMLTQEKESISRQVSIGTELSGLAIKIKGFIDKELAPISYSSALREAYDCDTVQKNLIDIIEVVEDWCREMRTYLVNKNTNDETIIIEGEVIE